MHTNRLRKLLNQLKSSDPSIRRKAAETLSQGDERAIYPLIKALRDSNTGVQDAAIRSLMNLKYEQTAYMVIPLLREESFIRNSAMIILQELDSLAVPLLEPLLSDKDDDIRKFALDLLYEIGKCNYPDKIVDLLINDPNSNVRAAAAKTLGRLKYKDALPHLLNAIKDEEWVCFSSLQAMIEIGDDRVIDQICGLLQTSSDAIRFAVIEALGNLGSQKATPYLLNHLQQSDEYEKKIVIKALINIGTLPHEPEITDILIQMLNDDWDEKLIAVKGLIMLNEQKALGRIIDIAGSLDPIFPENEERLSFLKNAILQFGCNEILLSVIKDPSTKYRGKVIAIESVGELKCTDAVSTLINLLNSDIRDVRRSSIEALGKIDDPFAREKLLEAISDDDSHVRKSAARSLGMIGDKRAFEPLLEILKREKYADVVDEIIKALMKIDYDRFMAILPQVTPSVKERIDMYSNSIGSGVKC